MPIPFESSVGSFPLTGLGTLALSNSSVLLSTLTAFGNSSSFPTTPTVINIKVSTGGGIAYLCPYGGTATSSVGIPIDPGTTMSFNLRNPAAATLISASSSTITAWW